MNDSTSQVSGKSKSRPPTQNGIGSVSFSVLPSNRIDDATVCGEASSSREKHCQLFKLCLLSAVPGLILVIRNTISLVENVKQLEANARIEENIRFSLELGLVIHECQKERGTLSLYVSSQGDPFLNNRKDQQFRNTDKVISDLSEWIRLGPPSYFASKEEFRAAIRNFTDHLDPKNATLKQVIDFYTDNNAVFIEMIGRNLNSDFPVPYWAELVAYQMLIVSKEQAGIERALGSTYYTRGRFPTEDHLWYKEKLVLGEAFLEQCMRYSAATRGALLASFFNIRLSSDLNIMRDIILDNNYTVPSVFAGTLWFDNMTEYINILLGNSDQLAIRIVEHAGEEHSRLENSVIASSIELGIAICIIPAVAVLVHRVLKRIQDYASELATKTQELQQERRRTEGLLYQLLPRSVARKLMNGHHAIPEAFHSATIMFSDVVGFTSIASRSTPMQVVNMLNKLYLTFDSRMDQFDVYKVETIGDGYMVSSGLPTRNGDRHVAEIAKLTLDLLESVTHMEVPHLTEVRMSLRMGFNTGPCVAGVVGLKMPRYCVFGDTVNTASRMESTSLPSKIQVSESSAILLRKHDGFTLCERGVLHIKGKGPMRTYWLIEYDKDSHLKNKLLDVADEPTAFTAFEIEVDQNV